MTETQITSISTALTGAVNSVLSTFIDLLPIIALVVGVTFGIKFVMRQFNTIKNTRG